MQELPCKETGQRGKKQKEKSMGRALHFCALSTKEKCILNSCSRQTKSNILRSSLSLTHPCKALPCCSSS
jgi:hypothetical protein